MKRVSTLLMLAVVACSAIGMASGHSHNDAEAIPLLAPLHEESDHWTCVADVAQYRLADWDNVIGRAQNVSLEQAKEIADSDPRITFFFYTKGCRMILENFEVDPPIWRVFEQGDAVFFSGEPWWGSAPGLADGYVK